MVASNRGPKNRPFHFGAVGDVELAVGILVDSQSVFGDMDGSFRQLDVLNDVKVAGGCQPEPFYLAVINLVFDGFVNAIGQQWRA